MKRIVLFVAALAAAASVHCQAFPIPGKPIRVLVGFAPGGGTDIQARIVQPKFAEAIGVPVLVENKPGAGTSLAAAEVARAAPDGHTLLYTFAGTMAQLPFTLANIPYDPLKDFTPVSVGAKGSLVLTMHPSIPANNAVEMIAWGKANPGKLNIASFGTGTSSHLFAELLMRQSGVEMVHVPYRGTGEVIKDLLVGRVHLYFDAASSALPNTSTGRLKMIGVVAPTRSKFLPQVPTLTEQGFKGVDVVGWLAYFGPANLPRETLQKLNGALAKALAHPEVKAAIEKGAYESVSSTPEELGAMVREEHERWGKVIRDLGVKPQ